MLADNLNDAYPRVSNRYDLRYDLQEPTSLLDEVAGAAVVWIWYRRARLRLSDHQK